MCNIKDNSVDYVYSHWDGYPEHNGVILYNYYSNIHTFGEFANIFHTFNNQAKKGNTFRQVLSQHFSQESADEDYAWFVWQKGWKGETVVKWIN